MHEKELEKMPLFLLRYIVFLCLLVYYVHVHSMFQNKVSFTFHFLEIKAKWRGD